jgi:hypothetical protein
MMARMLLIAPDRPELQWALEVELLGGALHTVPLIGQVDAERVTKATSGERFTVLHIASDGDDAGVLLSEGLLTKEELAQIARHVRAELVFLNACRSAALAQYLACQGVPCVIAYTVPVLDRNALRTASYYYEELVAQGMDYRRAFEKVTPCDGSLAWFAGAGYIDKAIEPLIATIGGLQQEMVTLRRTTTRSLAAMGVINLLAMGTLLSVALPAAYGQTIPPSPLVSPLATASATATSVPISTTETLRLEDEPFSTALPLDPLLHQTDTPLATATATATDMVTSGPRPTVALPTPTPDEPATATALPPVYPLPNPTFKPESGSSDRLLTFRRRFGAGRLAQRSVPTREGQQDVRIIHLSGYATFFD